jgi:hypothetical protein
VAASARGLAAILAALLVVASLGGASTSVAQEAATAPATAEPSAAPQPISKEKIDQLVAPIALYPDNLLGQILAASTYPLEVVFAARWVAANPKVTGQALEDSMQQQTWDPSVKALTAVPQVLQMMSDKVEWTRDLGDAYLSQPDDIAASVQRLRARADASGNLKETSKLKVRRERAPPPAQPVVGVEPLPEYIVIEPVEPDVVYVPVYDPWVVYGVWPYPYYRPFYWYPPGYVTVGIIGFGAPCVVGAAIWARYSWYSRRVTVNVVNYNRFNRVTLANANVNHNWKHDPAHRGSLSYSTPKLQQQFGKTSVGNINQGPKFGPDASQKVLSTRGITGTPGSPQGIANLNGKPNPNARTNQNAGPNASRTFNNNLQTGTNTGKPVNVTNNNPSFSRSANTGNNPNLTGNANTGNNPNLTRNANIGNNPSLTRNPNTSNNPNLTRNANISNDPSLKRNAHNNPNLNRNVSSNRLVGGNQNLGLRQTIRPIPNVRPHVNPNQRGQRPY